MDARRLNTSPMGATGMEITRVGFGAWQIGGGGRELEWGPRQEEESIAAIHRALELGVNWIDTAAGYGYGRSERLIGRALAGLREADRPFVFTKCSLRPDGAEPAGQVPVRDFILREAEASLDRLGIGAIDLYQIHKPFPEADIEVGWSALAELRAQRLVRHIGVSNFDVAQLRRIHSIVPVETLQPLYSVVDRSAENELLPFAGRAGIGVIVYSPMGSGLLTGTMTRERIAGLPDTDWRKTNSRFTEPQLSQHLAMAARLRVVGGRHGVTPGAVAVAWTLRNPAVDGAIAGFRRPSQVDPIVAAANLKLTAADAAELETGL